MPVNEITLKKSAGEPTVSVMIGQAQFGQYDVKLKNPKTGTRTLQQEGDNADDISDTFKLKTKVASLDQHIMSWWIIIAAPAEGEGQTYFARVEVRQKDQLVPGGVREYSGILTPDPKNIIDAAKFVVV